MERSKQSGGRSQPAARADRAESQVRLALGEQVVRPHVWLRQTIESTVLPRLVTDARAELLLAPDGQGPDPMRPHPEDVHMLAELLLREDFDACERFVERFQQAGYSAEHIMLELLAPAARVLGAKWESDACLFTEVTLGLGRLQGMVFGMGREPGVDPEGVQTLPVAGRRALLLAMPGSHHTLGVLMLSEFFRRGGWDVCNESCDAQAEIQALVSDHWFDLIGLSASTQAHLEALPSVILSLRRRSRNPDLVVMVGGPSFAHRPELSSNVGADFTASDARQAVEEAVRWVELSAARS
jgi:methanogenic corrinoid protein MtbC1